MKNEGKISSEDKLKIIIPYESFGPSERHAAKINGAFKRIQKLSPTPSKDKNNALAKAARIYIHEILKEHYPIHTIRKIVRCYSNLDARWLDILKQINEMITKP